MVSGLLGVPRRVFGTGGGFGLAAAKRSHTGAEPLRGAENLASSMVVRRYANNAVGSSFKDIASMIA